MANFYKGLFCFSLRAIAFVHSMYNSLKLVYHYSNHKPYKRQNLIQMLKYLIFIKVDFYKKATCI